MPTAPNEKGPLRRLLTQVNAHAWPFWGGMALINLGRLVEAFIPLLLGIGIDRIAAGNRDLALPVLGILAAMAVRYVVVAAGRYHVRNTGVFVAYDLRQKLYAHLQLQGPGFFHRYPTGDLMARAINDLQLIRQLVGLGSRLLFVLGFSGIVAFSFMFVLAPQLAVVLLPVLPFVGWVGWRLAKRIYDQSIVVQEGFSSVSGQVQENLNGIRTIQTHGQEDNEIARFTKASSLYAEDYVELMRSNSALTAAMLAMTGLSILVIVGYGGSLVMAGAVSVGTFTSFLFYLNMMLAPIKEAGIMVTLFQRGASAATRVFEILDHEPEIRTAEDAAPLDAIGGALTVQHLTYRHPGQDEANAALDGVAMEINAGETVAILGRIGSGKSTLLRLFVRLLDPAPGTVYLDGRDVRQLPLDQLRAQIALVPQEPFLFAERLGGNIAYDNPERTDETVWDAASAADLAETIDRFPSRLDTLVGERGVTLSGGQKQRASLARGLIRETPVLLLDDCFSSVDTETEEKILSQLKARRQGRTTVLVSHRVSTARHADRIVVLDNGRVAETGTHTELMRARGLYAALAEAQSQRAMLTEDLSQHAGGAE